MARRGFDTAPLPVSRAVAPLSRVFALARPEWRLLVPATVFLLAGTGTGLLFPQGLKILIDEAITAKRLPAIDRIAAFGLVLFVVQAVVIALRAYFFSIAGERVVTRLRTDLYRRVVEQEIAFFDQSRTGELTSRLTSDVTQVQSTVAGNLSMTLRSAVQVIGAVAMLLWTSPVLTVLMLAIVPPVALGAISVGRRLRKLSKEVQDTLASANEVAEESLSGIRTVRSFAAEEQEAARYRVEVGKAYELARHRARVTSTFMGAVSFAVFGAATVVFWYGARLVVAGQLTAGSLSAFLVYTIMVGFSLASLGDLWADFLRAAGAAQRVFELIDRVPAMPTAGGAEPGKVAGAVRFEEVSFAYPSRKDLGVLSGIDLALAPGETVALVGPSGAGKSTIAALLARFYDPDEGRILLDGHDLKALDPSWLRRQIGAVSQEPLLFSTTIAENILYGRPGAPREEVEAAAKAANAEEFIRSFPDGYDTKVGERGVQLSGGQKQRVAIARALLKDPRILVLDEATSALDAQSEHLVQEALTRLMVGRTTLIIAHRLSTVVNADRVVVLDGGKIVEEGPHQALVSKGGLYRKLVERQFAG